MKGYLVYNGRPVLPYTLFKHFPIKENGKWTSTVCDDTGVRLDKEDISSSIKLPEENDIVTVAVSIIERDMPKVVKGSKVTYSEFSLSSFLIGGFIYGGNYNHYTVEVLGVDWYNNKLLVQKHDSDKPKWYDMEDFTFDKNSD